MYIASNGNSKNIELQIWGSDVLRVSNNYFPIIIIDAIYTYLTIIIDSEAMRVRGIIIVLVKSN